MGINEIIVVVCSIAIILITIAFFFLNYQEAYTASFLLPRKKHTYYNEGGFLKMEINKQILVGSIGTAIVVIAGGVYANIKAMKKIRDDIKCIKNAQVAQEITNSLQDVRDLLQEDDIDSLKKKVDSLEKSNKK